MAEEIIVGGIYERGPSGVARVTNPVALETLKAAFEAFFRGGGKPRTELLPAEIAAAFPRNTKPPLADRCWLAVALDCEGRVSYQTFWVSSFGPSQPDLEKRALLEGPSFTAWRAIQGWGTDFMARGQA